MPPQGFVPFVRRGVPLVFACFFHSAIAEHPKQTFRGCIVGGSEERSGQEYFLSEFSFQWRAWRHYAQWKYREPDCWPAPNKTWTNGFQIMDSVRLEYEHEIVER